MAPVNPLVLWVFSHNTQGLYSPLYNMANITVIPKPGKDPGDVGNYRPISLINKNLKLLTKILANRLASFFASYVHKDQVGLIPGRQGA